ncbi:MAG: hypothetical protein ABI488_19735 [Polyangiaceae bacterium]
MLTGRGLDRVLTGRDRALTGRGRGLDRVLTGRGLDRELEYFLPSGIGWRWAARAALQDRMRLVGQFS